MGVLDYDQIPGNNTSINGIGIQGTSVVQNFDNALRQYMADMAAYLTRRTTKAANYTAVKTDNHQLIEFTAAATLSLTAAATLGDGWTCMVRANGGDVVIDPNSSETINGSATQTLKDGNSTVVVCNGTAFFTVGAILPNDASAARSNLSAQASHAKLTNFSALAGGADKLPMFSGTDTLSEIAKNRLVGHPSVTTATTDFNDITSPGFHSELCRGGSGYCPNSPATPSGAYWVVENQVYSATTITQFAWPYGPNLVTYPNMGVMVRHRFSGTWTSWQSLITGKYQEVHAILRAQANGTWVLLDDTDHDPIGISSVSQTSTGITVNFDFTATKVHSFSVTTDETMAKERVHCGASVALGSATIQLFETSSTPVNPSAYTNTSANLWLSGKFTV